MSDLDLIYPKKQKIVKPGGHQKPQKRVLATKRPPTPPKQPVSSTPVRPDVRTTRRVKVRYAFEFFQDQIFKLKDLRRNALIRDEDFSMSNIVRKALDSYLEKTEK